MPSSYPFPSVAALSLAMLCSSKTVDRLPRVVEYEPHDTVLIVSQTDRSLRTDPMLTGEYL